MSIYINDVWYDVSHFKHPGGHVIKHYYENDATDVFNALHFRSKKAKKVLSSLPVLQRNDKPDQHVYDIAINCNSRMIQDFNNWRISLIKRGFFEPSYVHVAYRLGELVLLFLLATHVLFNGKVIMSLFIFGFFSGRCGWIQHECGHLSFTCNKTIDKILQIITIGFGLSTSGTMWNRMHNRHHASTQKETLDMDLDTLPFVAFYKNAIDNSKYAYLVNRYWIKYQAYTFLMLTSGLFVMSYWIFLLHPLHVIRNFKLLEGCVMVFSHIIHTTIFKTALQCSYVYAYFLFFVTKWIAGIYLFGHFSTSHTFTKTVKAMTYPTWVDYALYHTVDISTQNPFISWFMGYLNCQCVHHLFPQMPQFRQHIVSKELETFAKKWNKPYQHIGYFEAWYKTFSNLNKVGNELSTSQKMLNLKQQN